MSMRKFMALIPVCALAIACGGESVPEAQSPEGAAAGDEMAPADAEAAPSDAAAPADGAATDGAGDTAAPAGDTTTTPAPAAE